MANPVRGEIPLEVNGTRYTFVLNTYALAAVEQRLGMAWPKLFKRATDGDWGIQTTLAVFHAGLLKHHRRMTEEEAADLVDALGFNYVMSDVIIKAIQLMQPAGADGGGEGTANPRMGNGGAVGMSTSPNG